MRVGLVSPNAQKRNAIGNYLAHKLAFFLERGAEVRLFVQSAQRLHRELRGYTEVVAGPESAQEALAFLADADLIFFEYSQAFDLLQLLPLLVGGKPRLVLDYHGVTPPEFWTGPQRELMRQATVQRNVVWCCDSAIVHSRHMQRDLARATGFPEERLHRLHLPVSGRFTPQPSSRTPRPRLGLEQAFLLLFVGRLAANKRVPVLIEALARLRDQAPAVHAVMIGSDDDVYGEEARRSRELADRLGVAERLHWLGDVPDDELAAWYGAADVLVIPSVHEGYCVPVREALACGLPVLAARATALPETVGRAGLTFAADDVNDLERQLRRLLPRHEEGRDRAPLPTPRRVALVCFRFAANLAGGAERSLRTIAQALQKRGVEVEVFTTCTRSEANWRNELPAGAAREDGLTIHRFRLDTHDRQAHLESVRRIVEAGGVVERADEQCYLEHSIHSADLCAELARRIDDFDALITGPYLFGLTADVARVFPEKTLVLPCFHDEPIGRLRVWPEVYGRAAGVLYHSPEEQELAEAELGVNHPNAQVIGTYLPVADLATSATEIREAAPSSDEAARYLVYCGRYSAQKGVPQLLQYAERYWQGRPGRFRLVFLGDGEVPIPEAPWVSNLGFVDEDTKARVLREAAALVQWSRQESLSLVVLEAWAQGTPVLVNQECAVLAGQVQRSGGGAALRSWDGFAAALDDLWDHPDRWRALGRRGWEYTRREYGCAATFSARLLAALQTLRVPLSAQMRRRGPEVARANSLPQWRDSFGDLVERLLDEGREVVEAVAVVPYRPAFHAAPGTTVLVPVRAENHGSHAALDAGPGRCLVHAEVLDVNGRPAAPVSTTPLAGILPPGKHQSLAVAVRAPAAPGEYQLRLHAHREDAMPQQPSRIYEAKLIVGAEVGDGPAAPVLEAVEAVLAEIAPLQQLPDDYVDVTQGRFARWKRWLKAKLLGNFKRGYVDVLSRQQSQVNQKLLLAVRQLAECCALLDQAVRAQSREVSAAKENKAGGKESCISPPCT